MKIAMGCAKVAYPLKEAVKKHVLELGHEVVDFCDDPTDPMPYAEAAAKTVEGFFKEKCDRGILLCGTGMGVSLVANMYKGITAAVCESKFAARRARFTNNANFLALGSFILGETLANEMVDEFLNAGWLENAPEGTRRILAPQFEFIRQLEDKLKNPPV